MRKKRKSVAINSGSMADVAFLLLIFFMVVTTLKREKTLSMKLPPLVEGAAQKVADANVLTIIINNRNEIMVENTISDASIVELVQGDLLKMIDEEIKPIINIKMHPASDYQTYLQVISEIKDGIRLTKKIIAERVFDKSFDKLSRQQYAELTKLCGIRIMEAEIPV